jgi:hypothetical protein
LNVSRHLPQAVFFTVMAVGEIVTPMRCMTFVVPFPNLAGVIQLQIDCHQHPSCKLRRPVGSLIRLTAFSSPSWLQLTKSQAEGNDAILLPGGEEPKPLSIGQEGQRFLFVGANGVPKFTADLLGPSHVAIIRKDEAGMKTPSGFRAGAH